MKTVIEVQHLHKNYEDTVAVDDVSLTVYEGEIFGILGPNGAGNPATELRHSLLARALPRDGCPGTCAALSELVVMGVADGGGAVGGSCLGEDAVDVGFHGVGAEVQLGGDVGVGLALGDHGQDLGFPLGQPVG